MRSTATLPRNVHGALFILFHFFHNIMDVHGCYSRFTKYTYVNEIGALRIHA